MPPTIHGCNTPGLDYPKQWTVASIAGPRPPLPLTAMVIPTSPTISSGGTLKYVQHNGANGLHLRVRGQYR